jgi:hypothetical protein
MSFLSEEETEHVVIEVVCHKVLGEAALRKRRDRVEYRAVSITLNDRDLIPLGSKVWPVVRELGIQ